MHSEFYLKVGHCYLQDGNRNLSSMAVTSKIRVLLSATGVPTLSITLFFRLRKCAIFIVLKEICWVCPFGLAQNSNGNPIWFTQYQFTQYHQFTQYKILLFQNLNIIVSLNINRNNIWSIWLQISVHSRSLSYWYLGSGGMIYNNYILNIINKHWY